MKCVFCGWLVPFWIASALPAAGAVPESIGLSLLRSTTTNLNGSGVRVVQAEAPLNESTPPPFQVAPASVGYPTDRFTYFVGPPATNAQSSSVFPNSLGTASGHAAAVASFFFGFPSGMSTNVAHIDNFEAGYFFATVVPDLKPISGRVVVQAYIMPGSTNEQLVSDAAFDDYAAQFNTLFVSGIGNGGPVNAPSTCYNGLGIGAYGGASSVGPTPENGRAKPDLVAPAEVTSYSTPLVAGAAALLLQAGGRGDGGPDTNAATDIRTIKALLINGAIKPSNWNAPSPSPLDPRHGSGVLNVFNSWNQLIGGKRTFTASSVAPTNATPAPVNAGAVVPVFSGWDFNTVSSSAVAHGINHYLFDLETAPAHAPFTATVTLVWNRQKGKPRPNDLDLLLCDAATGTTVAASTSRVDNVEHLYVPSLPQGRYDLRIVKRGGERVSNSETYALAFEFFTMPLLISGDEQEVLLRWPDYPDGFVLETAEALGDAWMNAGTAPILTNRWKEVPWNSETGNRWFRLKRP